MRLQRGSSSFGTTALLVTPLALLVVAATSSRSAERSAPATRPATVLGYVVELPPESPEQREARHRRVAERRAGTMIIVHRGAYNHAPENTLEAHSAAMDRGADGCEIDIRRSKDGVLYLHHDDELGRIVEGKGAEPVKDLTYFELIRRPLKKVYGSANGQTRPPTLAAVLEVARRRAMLLHLDIKEPGLEDDIAKLLDAADAWDHVVHVNNYNSEKLRADPRVKTFHFKGWLNEAGEGGEAIKRFLAKPAPMIMVGGDPAPAARVLGRTPEKPVRLPDGLRIEWGPNGPVRAKP